MNVFITRHYTQKKFLRTNAYARVSVLCVKFWSFTQHDLYTIIKRLLCAVCVLRIVMCKALWDGWKNKCCEKKKKKKKPNSDSIPTPIRSMEKDRVNVCALKLDSKPTWKRRKSLLPLEFLLCFLFIQKEVSLINRKIKFESLSISRKWQKKTKLFKPH